MSKPSQVVIAIRIMWGLLIAGALLVLLPATAAILASEGVAPLDLVPLVMIVVIFGVLALLVRSVSTGRNWARLLYGAIAVVSILAVTLSMIRAPEFALIAGSLRVAVIAIYGLVLYLLFHPASSQWFKNSHAGVP